MSFLRRLRPGADAPDHRAVFAEFRRTIYRLIIERQAAREPRIIKFPRMGVR